MKKLILLTIILLTLGYGDIFSQPIVEGGTGLVYRDAASSSYDRGHGGGVGSSSIWGAQSDYSIDLTISGWTPTAAAAQWTGPDHSGMGAVGQSSFTAGMANRASGTQSAVFGLHNVAGPLNSATTSTWTPSDSDSGGQFAFGYGNQATGNYALSGGEGTTASGAHSFSFGENTVASGSYSTALGFETDATDYGSLVIGLYNSSGSSATSAASYSASAPAFVIGNGSNGSLSDAFKVLFSGNTTMAGDLTVTGNDVTFGNGETISNASDGTVAITATTTTVSGDLTVTGNDIKSSSATAITLSSDDVTIADDLTVTGDVNVSSDARLKSNIISLGSTLSKLLLIDGKSYTMIRDGDKKIGVLAQEVQKVFPELVSEDGNEMLSVNYQGLVPVLINAIKEQEDKISRLENLVEQLIQNK